MNNNEWASIAIELYEHTINSTLDGVGGPDCQLVFDMGDQTILVFNLVDGRIHWSIENLHSDLLLAGIVDTLEEAEAIIEKYVD